jgi:hypothetical protein
LSRQSVLEYDGIEKERERGEKRERERKREGEKERGEALETIKERREMKSVWTLTTVYIVKSFGSTASTWLLVFIITSNAFALAWECVEVQHLLVAGILNSKCVCIVLGVCRGSASARGEDMFDLRVS